MNHPISGKNDLKLVFQMNHQILLLLTETLVFSPPLNEFHPVEVGDAGCMEDMLCPPFYNEVVSMTDGGTRKTAESWVNIVWEQPPC